MTFQTVTDFEACACPLCDAEATDRQWERRSDVKCLRCGTFSIMHTAARAPGRAVGSGPSSRDRVDPRATQAASGAVAHAVDR